jgi:hypothetical protein
MRVLLLHPRPRRVLLLHPRSSARFFSSSDGGTGRRARLRGVWGNPCEFDSRSEHLYPQVRPNGFNRLRWSRIFLSTFCPSFPGLHICSSASPRTNNERLLRQLRCNRLFGGPRYGHWLRASDLAAPPTLLHCANDCNRFEQCKALLETQQFGILKVALILLITLNDDTCDRRGGQEKLRLSVRNAIAKAELVDGKRGKESG